MDIVNYLRQLFFSGEKVVEKEVCGECEDTFFECEECGDIVKQTDDCDFCTMVGSDICCLHRTNNTFGMAMLAKASIVNSDKKCKSVTINYNGYSFTAVFSDTSNRWILVYGDEDESDDDDVEDEHELYDQRMYRMYLNMTKAVKGDRWTFAEYKAVVARDKARLNRIINR